MLTLVRYFAEIFRLQLSEVLNGADHLRGVGVLVVVPGARESYFAGKLPPQGYTFLSKTGKKLTHESVAKIVRNASEQQR